MRRRSHYDWLHKHWLTFANQTKIGDRANKASISADGDKCYQYRDQWAEAGIPFEHGVAIYLLSYYHPYNKTVRETDNGWVAPVQWVIDNYKEFKNLLPKV